MTKILTIIESPYAGDVEAHLAYARQAVKDSIHRGEVPFGSHLLYTQPGILDDTKPEERRLGINTGLRFYEVAERSAFYVDRGFSRGMAEGFKRAVESGVQIEFRSVAANTPKDAEELRQSAERFVRSMGYDAFFRASVDDFNACINVAGILIVESY